MKEQFFVMQMVMQLTRIGRNEFQSFILINRFYPEPPATFESYEDAETWIFLHGEKEKFYQIQKYIMPLKS